MTRILVNTGDGKGKSTAAFGLVARAAGHGLSCYVMQFMKQDATVGEVSLLAKLPGVTIRQCGRGFVPSVDSPRYALHRKAAIVGLAEVVRMAFARQHAIYVLDEVCGAIAAGLLETSAVMTCIAAMDQEAVVVCTGRAAPPALIDLADTVTEMRCVKHGYAAGIPAQDGVER